MFVFSPIEYAIAYNIPFTTFYIALEESKEEFIDSYLIFLVYVLKKKIINRFDLQGFGSKALDPVLYQDILDIKDELAKRLARVEIIDAYYKPTAMFKELKRLASEYGTFSIEKDESGNDIEVFNPNLKGHRFLVVCDHISLIEEEYDEDLKSVINHSKSIAKWHTKFARKIVTKQWKMACLNIQQQSLESEKQQFTSKGDTIIEKILPSLDGVANNREVIRDDYVVIGIFSPDRYGIEYFRGYQISLPLGSAGNKLGDNFRSVHVLKNRFGTPNKTIPLFFNGKVNFFTELPIPKTSGDPVLDPYYSEAERLRLLN